LVLIFIGLIFNCSYYIVLNSSMISEKLNGKGVEESRHGPK
jgi:hypothetical protein